MYLAEARSRWYSYPPPYWYNGQFVFATPWLWLDGDKHAGYTYSNWGNLISNRMNEESPMAITMWGNYDPSSRTGTVYAKYYNESPEPMTGKVLFVITEDSIQRSVPNGDQWHNHVARDYIPDYIGTQFTIGREDSVIYSQPFTLASNWNVNQCEIVTFFQSTTLTPDSIKEIYQGGTIKVMNLLLPGIEEEHNLLPNHTAYVNVFPNPCQNQTRFELSLPNGTDYKIGIFDISGREIKTLNGVMTGMKQIINCDFPNTIKSGIYFYRLESKKHNSNGKIIIQ